MIRLATAADIPRLVELGSLSLKTGPYKNRVKDVPAQAEKLAQFLIAQGKVTVTVQEGQIVGLFAIGFFPHYYTGEQTAAEVMWFVLPEWRKKIGMDAIALLRASEREARVAGCTMLQLAAPTEEMAKLYETAGYKALEVGFYKDLN